MIDKKRGFFYLTLWLRPFGQASSSPGSLLQQRRQHEDHHSKEEPRTSGSCPARCRIQTLPEGAAHIVPTGLWHSKPKPGCSIKTLYYQAQECLLWDHWCALTPPLWARSTRAVKSSTLPSVSGYWTSTPLTSFPLKSISWGSFSTAFTPM